MKLALDAITLDTALQTREDIDVLTVEHYAQAIKSGDALPPVVVFFDGASYLLADGHLRWYAYKALGRSEIEADVRPGDKLAALRYALAANSRHGMQREHGGIRRAYRKAMHFGFCAADDTRAVQRLLSCTRRWAQVLTLPARRIAKATRDAEIARLAAEGVPGREIARRVGVAASTVRRAMPGLTRET